MFLATVRSVPMTRLAIDPDPNTVRAVPVSDAADTFARTVPDPSTTCTDWTCKPAFAERLPEIVAGPVLRRVLVTSCPDTLAPLATVRLPPTMALDSDV
jgi:hypothetical protein